jgi:hypothetical protein
MSKKIKITNPICNINTSTVYTYVCAKSSRYFFYPLPSSTRVVFLIHGMYSMGFRICLKKIK